MFCTSSNACTSLFRTCIIMWKARSAFCTAVSTSTGLTLPPATQLLDGVIGGLLHRVHLLDRLQQVVLEQRPLGRHIGRGGLRRREIRGLDRADRVHQAMIFSVFISRWSSGLFIRR